jgi:class 3 adenylate cyclase/tetratricopeptide (TPR) repeat protein
VVASMDVGSWLRNLGLERYEPAFRQNDIDSQVLPKLTAKDLKDLGIASVGDRRRLLEAIVSLPQGAFAPSISSSTTNAERRQLTVMFCDLVGSTAIASRLDPEDLREIIGAFHRCASGVIARSGGFVAKYLGDGLLAYYGYPQAHEDDAERAVRAGLTLVDAVARLDTRVRQPLQLRVGIANGLVVVGDLVGEGAAQEQAVIGETPNLAARLQAFAEPSQVVIASSTRQLTRGLFDYRDLGPLAVKGLKQPVQAWQVLRPSKLDSRFEASREIDHAPGEARRAAALGRTDAAVSATPRKSLTPYLGRAGELELLEGALAEMAGHVRVIDIVGEPGIGKSRLLYEFRRRLSGRDIVVLSGSSWPDSQLTPFRPFIEVVRRSFGVSAGEAQEDVARKLREGMEVDAITGEESLALLLNLLGLKPPTGTLEGLDGAQIGLRTRSLLLRLLRQRCQTKPVVMLLEDLQWIDSASEELLRRIITRENDLALLILTTFRPEYAPPWSGKAGVMPLRVEPLSAGETSQIVQMRLGLSVINASLARLVADRAEGNPLFAEEIANFLAERSSLQRNSSAPECNVGPVVTAIPASLQLLLSARVDRLATSDRALLQVASVIGRRFEPGLLQAVSGDFKDVHGRLGAMELLDLVHVDPRSGEFLFKHALLRDVLNGSLLTGARTALHLKIAEEIERRNADRLFEVAEVLAYHYSRTNQSDKAIEYLAMAAAKSLRIYSLDEAEQFTRSALALVRGQDGQRMDVQVARFMADLVQIFMLKFEEREVVALLEPELDRIQALGDNEQVPILLYHYGFAMVAMCRFREAKSVQDKALAFAIERGHDRATAYARCGVLLLTTYVDPMPFADFEAFATTAFAEAERTNDYYLTSHMMYAIAWNYMHRGLVVEAGDWVRRLEALGQERQDPRSVALALWLSGWLDIIAGNYAAAVKRGEEGARTALTPIDRMIGNQVVGIAKILAGQIADGVKTVHGHRNAALKTGWYFSALGTEAALGVAMARTGELAKSVRWMETLIERSEGELGYRAYADFTRLFLAEIYLALLQSRANTHLHSRVKPPLRVLLANLWFLATVKRVGPKKVETLLNSALRNEQFHERGVLRSRIELDLGLLQKLLNKPDLARGHLMRARAAASAQHASAMLAKIDAVIRSL